MRCFGIVPLRNYESMKPNFAICVILILPLFAVFFVTSGHINLRGVLQTKQTNEALALAWAVNLQKLASGCYVGERTRSKEDCKKLKVST